VETYIHKLAEVQSKSIGIGTRIWQFCVVYAGAKIGDNCNICAHVLIEGDVVVGNNVTIKSGVQLWDGVSVEDNVFIGPNATFTNDQLPRTKRYGPAGMLHTKLKYGCSVGANATLLPGILIGEYALVGAGSVVSKDVLPHALVKGNPAKQSDWVCCCAKKLRFVDCIAECCGNRYQLVGKRLEVTYGN
jgi:acetyltransferase-like isoleucine patch superfamily enzyme